MKQPKFEISEEEAQKIKKRWAEDTLEQWAKEKGSTFERWAFKEMREPSISELGPIFFVAMALMATWIFVSDIFPADYIYGNIIYFFIFALLFIGIGVFAWAAAVQKEVSGALPEEPGRVTTGKSLLSSICLNLLFASFAIYSLSITCCKAETGKTMHVFTTPLATIPIPEFGNVFWYIGIAALLGVIAFIALSMHVGRHEALHVALTWQGFVWFYNLMLFSLQFLPGSQTYLAPYEVFLLFLSLTVTISITLTEIAVAPSYRRLA